MTTGTGGCSQKGIGVGHTEKPAEGQKDTLGLHPGGIRYAFARLCAPLRAKKIPFGGEVDVALRGHCAKDSFGGLDTVLVKETGVKWTV